MRMEKTALSGLSAPSNGITCATCEGNLSTRGCPGPGTRHLELRGSACRRAAPLAIATAASLNVLGASLLGLLSDPDIGLGCLPAPGEQLLRVFVAH